MAAFGYQHMTPFLLDPLALLQNMAKNLNFPSGGGLVMEVEEEGFLMNSHLDESSKKSLSVMMEVEEEGFLMNSLLDESSTKSLSVGDGEVNGPADQSSTVVNKLENGEQVPPMDMKRKNSSGSSLDSPKQKGGRERRSKRQKKGNGEVKEEENKGKPEKKDQKKIPDPPIGYIHVRARRGQATDSHSLAERVRREKISERMKILEQLVPGCDKVNGKALMLDVIINYVLSLQNQAEFLSMKLASFNPLFYEFGMYPDAFMVLPERPSIMESPSLSPMQQYSPTKTTTLVDANTTTATATTSAVAIAPAADTFVQAINYPLMDNSSSQLLQGQRPIDFTQDTASLLWDLEERRQRFLNPSLVQQQLEYLPLI